MSFFASPTESSPSLPSELRAGAEAPLQLLLFADQRGGTIDQVEAIRAHLEKLPKEFDYDLKIIDVGEQPYLAEHFRLVATPALMKVSPEPRQTLAGRQLFAQLEIWWPRWQNELAEQQFENNNSKNLETSLSSAVELLRLGDEIFRLKQENDALQDQLQFKDRIISMLAHDLRNPLTAASIALETLEGQWDESNRGNTQAQLGPDMLFRLAQHARTQTQVIERMITNLLLAARGQISELEVKPKRLDLKACINEVLADLGSTFSLKQQHIQTDIPADLPLALADPDRVRQICINLLENASKYTPFQGEITISALHRTTQKIQISICDNGPGVPADLQEKIFEDEYRLQRDQHQDGYGLGLALCRRIVRAHCGQIWVDSQPDSGSCFHFTLPAYLNSKIPN
jgi:two-component system clock-associated histidine kinase SasA